MNFSYLKRLDLRVYLFSQTKKIVFQEHLFSWMASLWKFCGYLFLRMTSFWKFDVYKFSKINRKWEQNLGECKQDILNWIFYWTPILSFASHQTSQMHYCVYHLCHHCLICHHPIPIHNDPCHNVFHHCLRSNEANPEKVRLN